MHVKPRLAARAAALGVALAAVLVPIAGATSAHATGPAITVAPNTGLNNGDTVSVTGSGFAASEGLSIVECSALSATGCDTGNVVTATTGADGSLAATAFVVHSGAIGDGTCAAGSSSCFLLATNAAHSELVQATLGFAAPPPTVTVTPTAGIKDGDTVTVHGAGYTPSAPIAILECSGLSQATCNIGGLVSATAAADGTVDGSIVVHTGAIGTGTCAASSSNCLIAVANEVDQTQVGSAPLGFGPQVYATPNSNLKAGQTVTVSGAGFPVKNGPVYVLQCATKPAGADGCNTGGVAIGQTNASGAFSNMKVKIVVGKTGAKGVCDSSNPCVITATTSTSGAAGNSGSAVITFAKVPPPTKVKTATAAKASAKSVKKGQKFTISGTVKAGKSGVKGLKETLYAGKKKVASATSGAGGKFTFKLKGGKATVKYYVSTAAKTIGSSAYQASKSKTITVKHKK